MWVRVPTDVHTLLTYCKFSISLFPELAAERDNVSKKPRRQLYCAVGSADMETHFCQFLIAMHDIPLQNKVK